LHWHRIHRRASARVLNLVTRGFMRRHRQTDRVAADATAPRTSLAPLQRDGDIGRRRLEGGSNRARFPVSGWRRYARLMCGGTKRHRADSRRQPAMPTSRTRMRHRLGEPNDIARSAGTGSCGV